MMPAGGSKSCSDNHFPVTTMNRIMLRFRPIAPKPSAAAADLDNTNVSAKHGRRTKRKYVRVRARQSNKRKSGEKEGRSGGFSPVTLQLLPRPDLNEKSSSESDQVSYRKAGGDHGVRSVTNTWITVECVTEIYSGLGFGVSDREKIRNLEADTCPGFVSDASNNVVWVNQAYRRLVSEENGGVMAWLVVKDKLPYLAPSFACRVRMIQQTKHGHKWNTIVPCDVSRMDFPGFAWKLDVNTALGLGI